MPTPTFRYTIEADNGNVQTETDSAAHALQMLLAITDRDGKAHIIDRLPTGDIRGFVVHKNT